jgi:hypothetical protein
MELEDLSNFKWFHKRHDGVGGSTSKGPDSSLSYAQSYLFENANLSPSMRLLTTAKLFNYFRHGDFYVSEASSGQDSNFGGSNSQRQLLNESDKNKLKHANKKTQAKFATLQNKHGTLNLATSLPNLSNKSRQSLIEIYHLYCFVKLHPVTMVDIFNR